MLNRWMVGDLSAQQLCKLVAGMPGSSMPVFVVPGDETPRRKGYGGRYETAGGDVIRHPGAYSKRGWSNMFYRCSTERVEVGATWLVRAAQGPGWREDVRGLVRCWVRCGSAERAHGWRAEDAWSMDGRLWLVVGPDGWSYHYPRRGASPVTARQAIRDAIHARRAQRDAEARLAANAGRSPMHRVLTAADIVAAGACRPGVEDWCRRAGINPSGEEAVEDLLTAATALGGAAYIERAAAR